jgi:predicted glutamine amidotransferase
MCAIIGYYCFGNTRPRKEMIEKLFIEAESRGTHASGYAYKNEPKEKVIVHKIPERAARLLETNIWLELEMPKVFIGHTRHATQGDKMVNSNNHPIHEAGSKLVLVHNGMISNDADFGVPRTTVDSLAILKALDKFDFNIEEATAELRGSFACAVLNDDNLEMTLFRHTNPTTIIYNKEEDILYFASLSSYFDEIVQSTEIRGFTARTGANTKIDYPEDTHLVIDEKGLKSKGLCNYKSYQTSGHNSYYSGYYDYRSNSYRDSQDTSKAVVVHQGVTKTLEAYNIEAMIKNKSIAEEYMKKFVQITGSALSTSDIEYLKDKVRPLGQQIKACDICGQIYVGTKEKLDKMTICSHCNQTMEVASV